MKLADAKIGYAGYSRDWRGPGDRRRFVAYARHRGLSIERAHLRREHDLVVVTHNGDIAGWTARKRRDGKNIKYVFELADSYFAQSGMARRFTKGIARFGLRIDSRLSPDFQRTLIAACEEADAVICSTEEQRETITRYNPKVFVSFDYFGDDRLAPKQNYARDRKLRLVWEGQSTTLVHLHTIREVLNDLRESIELHIVTDPTIFRHFGRYGGHPARDALRGIACDVHFHPWQLDSFAQQIVAADLAIIPIDPQDPFAMGKPENKLILFWQLGMPVLTSPTPAYRRAMHAAGVEMLCETPAAWGRALEQWVCAPTQKFEQVGQRCRAYADEAYSRAAFLARFDEVFVSLGFSI